MSDKLKSLLRHFPSVRHAFAYGSGVMHQPGLYQGVQPTASDQAPAGNQRHMVDLIFAIDNAMEWHEKNIALHQDHYSWLARFKFGHHVVCGIAEHFGVGVHFNTLVSLDGQLIKYGVVEVPSLKDDLLTWRQLYISGRMQKPVTTLLNCPQVAAAQVQNLRSALTAALLMLPPTFSTEQLLKAICGLSYHGDVRMGLAEDPLKVDRIVAGSRQGLEEMYLPLLQQPAATQQQQHEKQQQQPSNHTMQQQQQQQQQQDQQPNLSSMVVKISEEVWQQDTSQQATHSLMRALPVGLLHDMSRRLGFNVPEGHLRMPQPQEDILARVRAHSSGHKKLIADSLKSIVRRSSMSQAASGALATGGGKAMEYVAQKVRKALLSRRLPVESKAKAASQHPS